MPKVSALEHTHGHQPTCDNWFFFSLGINLGHQSWWQVPLPTEAAQVLAKFVFLHTEALFWETGFQ